MSVFKEKTLFGHEDKVSIAIERVRAFGVNGVIVAFSGGKDSVAVLDIVKKAGVPYRAVYNLTTVDHPELVKFIKAQKDVEIQRPSMNMWQIIEKNHALPTRLARFCCRILKEQTFPEGVVITGVRAKESRQRAERKMFEPCFKDNHKWYLHPIIDWSDSEVWEYIKGEKLPYCKLYDEGFKRLGCIGCPKDTKRAQVLDQYPQYKRGYIRALDKLVAQGYPKDGRFQTGQQWYDWWISNTAKKDTEQAEFIFLDNNTYSMRAHDARASDMVANVK